MAHEDIIGGLRNALERGENIRKASDSFINAGYDKKEVKEAVAALSEKKQVKKMPTVELPKSSAKKGPKLKNKKVIISGIVVVSILIFIFLLWLIGLVL